MAIHMTQFLRPDGRRTDTSINRPPEIERLAAELLQAGYAFEAEVLMNGVVSFEVVGPEDEDGDPVVLACELVQNGPRIPEAVDKLVRDAHAAAFSECDNCHRRLPPDQLFHRFCTSGETDQCAECLGMDDDPAPATLRTGDEP